MWHLLGRVDLKKQERLVRWILKQELSGGGWPIYAGGPAELNATVKAHVALRLAGLAPEQEVLRRSRAMILRLGGLERINSFEKTYLALFGLYPWDQVPALPPEVVLLPDWFPVNLYEISYWSRTILVPLAVLYGLRPSWKKAAFSVDDLWVNPASKRAQIMNFQKGSASWRIFFLVMNRLLQWHEKSPWKPFRRIALIQADRWMNERMVGTDGLGAIFPAMINAVFGLKALGYGDGDPLFEQAVKEMERLELPLPAAAGEDQGLKVQPCFSPLWDTAISQTVLGKAALPGSGPALEQAVRWIKESEVRVWGDWRVKNPGARPGGWAFEFRNPFYPDVDDTAQVLLGFQAFYGKPAAYSLGAFDRGLEWTLSMQNRDGGWGESCRSYDEPSQKGKGVSTASQTAWALMALMSLERANEPAFRKGIEYLLREQQEDGNWAEDPFTGTGFPRVFYLKYHLYRTYFPLLALIEAREHLSTGYKYPVLLFKGGV